MIDLCILGTGGSIPMPDRALSSLYIRHAGRGILVDCGEGTQIQIMKLGWGFRCIDTVLLTHYHADHCSGLPGFLLAQAKAGREEPLDIYGPVGLSHVIAGLRVIAPQLPYELSLHELRKNPCEFLADGLQITAFPLNHGIPCMGYDFRLNRLPRFLPEKASALHIPVQAWKLLQHGETVEINGTTFSPDQVMGGPRTGIHFLFATDTRPVPEISEYGAQSDLMILEGMYGEDEKTDLALKNRHMLFSEAAHAALAGSTRRLLLTHFSTSMEDPSLFLPYASSIFPGTECAEDLMVTHLDYPE